VVTASVRLSTLRYADSSKQAAFFQHALDRIEASPGVISAGATSALVHLENGRTVTFSVEGRDLGPRKERAKAEYFAITPRFLDTLRVPVRRGRGFAPQDDTQGHPVAIVNEAFARRYFPDATPSEDTFASTPRTRTARTGARSSAWSATSGTSPTNGKSGRTFTSPTFSGRVRG
jgi:putative ABC transport system permease protein